MKGYIYILAHKRMLGLVKIGHTTNKPEQRLAKINAATGVPGGFDIFYSCAVEDSQKVESEIHEKLKPFRLISSKEFYELKPSVAKDYVERIIENIEFGVKLDIDSMVLVGDSTRLGKLIRYHRQSQKIRQSDLAAKAGTGLRFIIDLEGGKATCQVGKILDALSALGLRLSIDAPVS